MIKTVRFTTKEENLRELLRARARKKESIN